MIPLATPRLMMSRASAIDAWTLVAPSVVTICAAVSCAGRTFRPLTSSGSATLVLVCSVPESAMKAMQKCMSAISRAAIGAYHSFTAADPPLASLVMNGSCGALNTGSRPGW